jgi:hypothetical protein
LVDTNPYSLKGPRCRVLTRICGRPATDGLGHQFRQLAGPHQGVGLAVGCLLAARHNRPRNRASIPFVAIVSNDLLKFFSSNLRQPLGCCWSNRGIHAHVQGTIPHEAKPPISLINLGGRHAKISQQAGHRSDAAIGQNRPDRGEGRPVKLKARVLESAGTLGRLWISIQGQKTALWCKPRQQGQAVSAAAKGQVHVDSAWIGDQGINGLIS